VPSIARLAAAVLAAALLASCTEKVEPPLASTSATPPLPTLPPGPLQRAVLQPDEVTRAFVPITAQTGARDLKSVAAFSANPKAAEKSLEEHGFVDAYVVQYGDPAASAVITNVATRFDSVEGAGDDLTADLAAADKTGATFAVTGLGEQAGGVRGKINDTAAEGTLLTLRWRVGATTWLLAVGGPKPVDEAGVRGLADRLMARVSRDGLD
jgi:hypothetical protein